MDNRLYVCADFERLTAQLVTHLKEDRGDPLVPQWVIVPHGLTETWLHRRIARSLGVAMNVRMDFPEQGFMSLLESVGPSSDEPVRYLGRPEMEMRIARILMDAADGDEVLAPLLSYLRKDEKARGPRYWRRVWQLSCRLTERLQDYEPNLPEMVTGWIRGILRDPEDRNEAAQAEIYRRLCAAEDQAMTLGMLARKVLESPGHPRPGTPMRVHLFCLSLYSPLQLEILAKLADKFEFVIYHCPPLMVQALAALDADGATADEATRVLRQWTKAPRLVWSRIKAALVTKAGYELVDLDEAQGDASAPAEGPGCLQQLQGALRLSRESVGGADDSFRILKAESAYREAEAVRDDILNLAKTTDVRLDDVLILVADPDEYLPVLRAVFEAWEPRIPFNVIGGASASAYAAAVENVFRLLAGPVGRDDVLSLVTNPCFLAHQRLDRSAVTVWRQWAEALGVFHSWSAESRQERGYGKSDRFTWRQGLRRLRLGQVMSPESVASDEGSPFRQYPPFRDLEAGDRAAVAAFDETMETLLTTLDSLARDCEGDLSWPARLRELLDSILSVPRDRPEEAVVVATTRATLDALDELAQTESIGRELVEEAVLSRLGLVEQGVKAPLQGITIAPLALPLRVPPVEAVYIVGFNEQAYPGSDPRSPLDLRSSAGGDEDLSLPDRLMALGLEAMLMPKRRLRITTLARDLQKDEPKFPSPMLGQLCRIARWSSGVVRKAEVAVPLHASSRAYLEAHPSLPGYSVWDQALGWLRWSIQENRPLTGELARAVQEECQKRTQLRQVTGRASQEQVHTVRLSLQRLRKFLEEPLTEALRRHLRLTEDAGDDVREDDVEPLEAKFPEDYRLHVQALAQYVHGWAGGRPPDVAEVAAKEYARAAFQGKLPEGAFGDVDRDKLVRQVKEAAKQLTPHLPKPRAEGPKYYPRLILGGAMTQEGVDARRFPALSLDLGDGRGLELRGDVNHWWVAEDKVTALCLTNSAKKPAETISVPTGEVGPDGKETKQTFPVFSKQTLTPFLMYASLLAHDDPAARELVEGRGLKVIVAAKDGCSVFAFGPLEPEAARKYLATLAAEVVNPGNFGLLPFDLVHGYPEAWAGVVTGADEPTYRNLLMGLVETDPEEFDSKWHPAERLALLRDLPGYVPAEPVKTLRRRLLPIYEARARGGQ